MFPTDDFESTISLESEKDGVIEEPPFRFLVLGDWSGDGIKKNLEQRRPLEIDRDNFDGVLQKLSPELELDLFDNGNPLRIKFNEIDDFHPDNLFRQISLFADLRDLRNRLSNKNTFNSAAREVRSWLDDSEPEVNTNVSQQQNLPVAAADNLLDRILSGDSSADKFQSESSGELNNLLVELVKPHLVSFDENEQSRLIAAVDESSGDLMRMILHHPKFQKLEASWRGLYFLVRRTETDSDLKIFILNTTKSEIAANLKSVNSLTDSFLYRILVADADKISGGEPWAFFAGDYAFDADVEDIAVLIRLSKIASAANAPFISHIRPTILGINSFADSPSHSDWNFSDESVEGKLWATVRSLPESNYLGLVVPRFLARLPYGDKTEPLENFSFEEFVGHPVHNQYLWTNSCFAASLLLAQSFRKFGWEMERNLIQDIEDLPVHIYKFDGEIITKPCAEVVFTQIGCEKIMDYGLMPLLSYRDTDRVRLGRFQSITNPVTALKSQWNK